MKITFFELQRSKLLSINRTIKHIFFNQEVHKLRVMIIYCVKAKKARNRKDTKKEQVVRDLENVGFSI